MKKTSENIFKRCTRCGFVKPLSDFCKDSYNKDGLKSACRLCSAAQCLAWRVANPEYVAEYDKRYYVSHIEQKRENSKQWYYEHPDQARNNNKAWCKTHKEERKQYNKQYYLDNPDIYREWRKRNPDKAIESDRRNSAKRLGTANGKLSNRMRSGIHHSLENGVKDQRKWETLVGYTTDQLKKHLEKHFIPGMSWANMGEWHIDHIIPISAFNYEFPEDIDFKRCWALKNLQPMWAADNIKKNDKVSKPFQSSLLICSV
jgi:hypothetical protein